MTAPLIGQPLGKYDVLEEVGRGGFAAVYRARDRTLEREVALKVLHPPLLADPGFVERFQREARTLAGLRHPHIVTIYEVGQAEGRVFIAMELAHGPSLARAIAGQGRLSWEQTLSILRPACEALDHAHQRGVTHRDLKPANILLDEERGPLLSDFGFARLVGSHSASLSLSGGVVGTPGYIAPEVWEQDSTGAPGDVYALGCIAYEMLTGRPLFPGQTPMQVMRAHDRGPQFPASWPEDVPPGITGVLGRAMARRPEERCESAGALWQALAELGATGPAAQAALAKQWRAETEAAMAKGEWSAARMALGRWLAVAPGDPAARAAQARLPRPPASAGARRPGLPGWAWAGMGAAALGLAVAIVLLLSAARGGKGGEATSVGAMPPAAASAAQASPAPLPPTAATTPDAAASATAGAQLIATAAAGTLQARPAATAPPGAVTPDLPASATARYRAVADAVAATLTAEPSATPSATVTGTPDFGATLAADAASTLAARPTPTATPPVEPALAAEGTAAALAQAAAASQATATAVAQAVAGQLAAATVQAQQDTQLTATAAVLAARGATATAAAEAAAAAQAGATALVQTMQAARQATATAAAQQATATAEWRLAGATRVREADGMAMVYVPAGEFTMGSLAGEGSDDEHPQHKVTLGGFWIDRTEATNAQYGKCVQAGACRASGCADNTDYNGAEQPVVCVDWEQATGYCQWAGARLPTEAEWEKAARGTDGRKFPWGNQDATCQYAVMYDGNNGCSQGSKAWPVGSKPEGASPYGVLDMAGNVWEWTADWYAADYYAHSPERNPPGPDSGQYRVVRGGSWGYNQNDVRSAGRGWVDPAYTLSRLGFRCSVSSTSSP